MKCSIKKTRGKLVRPQTFHSFSHEKFKIFVNITQKNLNSLVECEPGNFGKTCSEFRSILGKKS